MSLIKITNNTYCVGDIHGQPSGMEYTIREKEIRDSSMILVGDIGLGFAGNHVGPCSRLEKIAAEFNLTFYLFRGNHDNPESFTLHREMLEKRFPHVKILNDFDVLELNDGQRALIIGGSVSIDKAYRKEGKNWWLGELIDYKNIPTEHYDMVISHSGPTPPLLQGGSPFFDGVREHCYSKNASVGDVVKEEQEEIMRALQNIKPDLWVNGHFHVHEVFKVGNTNVIALDIDEMLRIC